MCPDLAVEKVAGFPGPSAEPTSTWVVVGVVVPVLVVLLIISILYWKFCRTDKLEFQPDTMVTGPQRQKVRPASGPSGLVCVRSGPGCIPSLLPVYQSTQFALIIFHFHVYMFMMKAYSLSFIYPFCFLFIFVVNPLF